MFTVRVPCIVGGSPAGGSRYSLPEYLRTFFFEGGNEPHVQGPCALYTTRESCTLSKRGNRQKRHGGVRFLFFLGSPGVMQPCRFSEGKSVRNPSGSAGQGGPLACPRLTAVQATTDGLGPCVIFASAKMVFPFCSSRPGALEERRVAGVPPYAGGRPLKSAAR